MTRTPPPRKLAPAWHRDVSTPARIRYWNGSRWTKQVRPLPQWWPGIPPDVVTALPTPESIADERIRRLRRLQRRLVGVAFILGLTAWSAFVLSVDPPLPAGERIDNEQWRAAAAGVCTTRLIEASTVFATASASSTDEQRAAALEGAARSVDDLATDIGSLPETASVVDTTDQTAIDGWIAWWREYADMGRLSATARSNGNEDLAALQRGTELEELLLGFAFVNELSECVPQFS